MITTAIKAEICMTSNPLLCVRLRKRAADELFELNMEREAMREFELKKINVTMVAKQAEMDEAMQERELAFKAREQEMIREMQEMEGKINKQGKNKEQDDAARDDEFNNTHVKVRMPRAPEMKNKVDGVTSDAWDKFTVGTQAYASVQNQKLGMLYQMIFNDHKANVDQLLEEEEVAVRKLDTAIFKACARMHTRI